MATVFRAHPVPEGDAFELRWNGKRILIDGGTDPELTLRFVAHGSPPLDAVLCTHNDKDHAGGLVDVLAAGYARSLWVPASWYDAVGHAQALQRKGELREWIDRASHEVIELLEDEFGESEERQSRRSDPPRDGRPDRVDDAEECVSPLEASKLPRFYPRPDDVWRLGTLNPRLLPRRDDGLLSVGSTSGVAIPLGSGMTFLHAYARIILLIQAALAQGIPVFPLEFQDAITNVPLPRLPGLFAHNSVPTVRIRRTGSLDDALRFTVFNKESLTFRFEHDGAHAFFCADSRLDYVGNGVVMLAPQTLVTVPHHGATENDPAYGRLVGQNRFWVRSDRPIPPHGPRPSAVYLALRESRYCTRCRGLGAWASAVEVVHGPLGWSTRRRPCCCVGRKPHPLHSSSLGGRASSVTHGPKRRKGARKGRKKKAPKRR
jgi:hypothetical protein